MEPWLILGGEIGKSTVTTVSPLEGTVTTVSPLEGYSSSYCQKWY